MCDKCHSQRRWNNDKMANSVYIAAKRLIGFIFRSIDICF